MPETCKLNLIILIKSHTQQSKMTSNTDIDMQTKAKHIDNSIKFSSKVLMSRYISRYLRHRYRRRYLCWDFAPPRPSPSSLLLSSSKAGEVLGLTPSNWGHGAAEAPSAYSSSYPAFISAAPMGSRSGVGTIVQRNEDFVDYTAGTSLSGRRLLLAFAFTRLNFDKE